MADTQELLGRAKNLAYFYLKFRPRTEYEIQEYLTKKKRGHKFTDDIIQKAIASLKDEKLIDDEAFIRWHVDRRSHAKPKSQMLLTKELMRYGIPREMIAGHFDSQELDEEALARKALVSRWPRLLRLSKEKRFQKAASFLQSRGFSYGVIKNTIAEMEKTDYN